MVDNPVASVMECEHLISSLVSALFGVKPNFSGHLRKKTRTEHFGSLDKGVFGTALGALGVHETQARGALHLHCVLFGGVPPDVLKKLSHVPMMHDAVCQVLDSHFSSSVPRPVHVRQIIQREMKKTKEWRDVLFFQMPHAFHSTPDPVVEPSAFQDRVCENCLEHSLHSHSFACHKGKRGTHRCRLNFPRGLVDSACCVETSDVFNDLGVPTTRHVQPPAKQATTRNCPFEIKTKRLLVWDVSRPRLEPPLDEMSNALFSASMNHKELIEDSLRDSSTDQFTEIVKSHLNSTSEDEIVSLHNTVDGELPEGNRKVVEHSPTILTPTSCNQCAMHLGDEDQSNASVFHISDYFEKNKIKTGHVLSSLQQAVDHVRKCPSVAEDSGTDKRTTQCMMTHLVNHLDTLAEFSDAQMVASLRGLKAEVCTEIFGHCGPNQAAACAEKRLAERKEQMCSSDSHPDVEDVPVSLLDGDSSESPSPTTEATDTFFNDKPIELDDLQCTSNETSAVIDEEDLGRNVFCKSVECGDLDFGDGIGTFLILFFSK